jgi:hypothetical protein
MSDCALKNLRKLRRADNKLDVRTSIEVVKSLRPKRSFPPIASTALEMIDHVIKPAPCLSASRHSQCVFLDQAGNGKVIGTNTAKLSSFPTLQLS